MENTAIKQRRHPQYEVARVIAAVLAFVMLTALCVVLWVPSAPIP